MAVNATLKSICALLKDGEPDLQLAALRVLGAIHTREPAVHRALGEFLITAGDPVLFNGALDALEETPHIRTLKYLLTVLEHSDGREPRVLDAIARIGPKVVSPLKQQFERFSGPVRRELVQVMPRIRAPQAHAFLIETFFNPDHEIVRAAVHGLREEIHAYEPKEREALEDRLLAALRDRRLRENQAALSAILISLGIVGDLRSKTALLNYVSSEQPEQIRRYALMSLGRLEYPGDRHHDVFEAVLPILEETDWEGLVRHAVAVLERVKPRRSDNEAIRERLQSRHAGVQAWALRALSRIDSITNAEQVMEFLHHPEQTIRDAAGTALRQMPSAVKVILRNVDDTPSRAQAFEMVRILEDHANRIRPKQAREMVGHMLELFDRGEDRYELYRTALQHLRGEILREELETRAAKAEKKKDYDRVRDLLRMLDHTGLLTEESRFRLAVAKLKTSRKDLARAYRLSDYCLEHIKILLHEDPKAFQRRLLAEKTLEPDDLLYVGYHFSEMENEQRRFGVDILRHVARKHARAKAGKAAKQKLKVEGH